jgi:hypothetical protein
MKKWQIGVLILGSVLIYLVYYYPMKTKLNN